MYGRSLVPLVFLCRSLRTAEGSRTFEIHWLCAPGHASAYPLEGYKTAFILETPLWPAGASELMKLDIIVLGASNKSGRH